MSRFFATIKRPRSIFGHGARWGCGIAAIAALGWFIGVDEKLSTTPLEQDGLTLVAAPSEQPDDESSESTNQDAKSVSDKKPEKIDHTKKQEVKWVDKYNPLSQAAAYVLKRKGTQPRSNGGDTNTTDKGTYVCRQCNAKLYYSTDKFKSHCGWPSFDDEIDGAVKRHLDADGYRVESVCANCDGHLGHVFEGEQLTEKNTRHCVNTISMVLVPADEPLPPVLKLEKKRNKDK